MAVGSMSVMRASSGDGTQSQRGLATGAINELLFGTLEHPARDFHAMIDRALDRP